MPIISRNTVSIRFYGLDLDPDTLSGLLKCFPTASGKKGDHHVKAGGEIRVIKKGFWHLRYGESDAVDLEDKILWLLGQLTDDLDVWREINRSIKSDVFCGVFMDGWNEGFELSPALMKKLADRSLKIDFDIYSPTQTWHEPKIGPENQEPDG